MKLIPKLSQELSSLVKGIITYLRNIITKFNRTRHFCSAKFTCQLAITEYDYEADNNYIIKPTPKVGETQVHYMSVIDETQGNTMTMTKRVLGKVNTDFTVDLPCPMNEMPDMEHLQGHISSACGAGSKERAAVDLMNAALSWEAQSPDAWNAHVDSFDQILEVTRKQDAIMSFYYLDESTQQVNVMELYNVTDADTSALLPEEQQKTNENLAWDEDLCTAGPSTEAFDGACQSSALNDDSDSLSSYNISACDSVHDEFDLESVTVESDQI